MPHRSGTERPAEAASQGFKRPRISLLQLSSEPPTRHAPARRGRLAPMTSRFLTAACRREPVDVTPSGSCARRVAACPVMPGRFAGCHWLLDLCRTPELAARVTLQPIQAIGVDAHRSTPSFRTCSYHSEPMGLPFDRVKAKVRDSSNRSRAMTTWRGCAGSDSRGAEGDVLETNSPGEARVEGARPPHRVRRCALHARVVCNRGRSLEGLRADEGAVSRRPRHLAPALRCISSAHDRRRLRCRPGRGRRRRHSNLRKLPWVGTLSGCLCDYRGVRESAYRAHLFEALCAARRADQSHFGTGVGDLGDRRTDFGGDVISADWRIPLRRSVGGHRHRPRDPENLDPTLLLGPRYQRHRAAEDILRRVGGRPGRIFNLGHGVLRTTPVRHVAGHWPASCTASAALLWVRSPQTDVSGVTRSSAAASPA